MFINSYKLMHSVDSMLQLQGHWLPPALGSIAITIEEDSFRVVTEDEL